MRSIDITMYECLIREHTITPLQKFDFSAAMKDAQERKAKGLPSSDNMATKRKLADSIATNQDIEDSTNLMLVSKTLGETRGHTSYLTFATFLPSIPNTPLEGN